MGNHKGASQVKGNAKKRAEQAKQVRWEAHQARVEHQKNTHRALVAFPSDAPTTWDEFYDNPQAQLVLVSKEKVGFRVDAYTFAKRR